MSKIVDSIRMWLIDKYPTDCDECPFFSERPYRDNAYQGYFGVCELGYMKHGDTREFSGRGVRWPRCDIEHHPYVFVEDRNDDGDRV